jgi:hypothetical protein
MVPLLGQSSLARRPLQFVLATFHYYARSVFCTVASVFCSCIKVQGAIFCDAICFLHGAENVIGAGGEGEGGVGT